IRSTFIVGFPGETEAEFSFLLQFLEQAQLDRVGCFAYSPVEGAAANDLPGAVPEAVKEERRGRFMEKQAAISLTKLKNRVGKRLTVLVDAPGVGRSKADAPEIDGLVRFKGGKGGEFAEVLIDRADEHDLHGKLQ
ncbi:MAG: 30S ribosomal protein S12 methylthiotransferase RimO, partial [Burkholderiales bacterium]